MGLCPRPDLSRAMKPARALTDDSLRTHIITPALFHITTRHVPLGISTSFFPRVLTAAIKVFFSHFWVHSGAGRPADVLSLSSPCCVDYTAFLPGRTAVPKTCKTTSRGANPSRNWQAQRRAR